MPVVRMPDNTQVRFPDDMSDDQIRSLISSKFPKETGVESQKEETWLDKTRGFGKSFEAGQQGVLRDIVNSLSFGGLYSARPDLKEKSENDIAKSPSPALFGIASGVGSVGVNLLPTLGIQRGLTYAGAKALPFLSKLGGVAKPVIATGKRFGKDIAGVGASATDAGARALAQDREDEAGQQMLDAVGFDIGTRLALGGVGKLFSAGNLVKGVQKTGLKNTVGNDKFQKVLDRGAKTSDKVAREIKAQAPDALLQTNKETIGILDKNLGKKVDISGEMAKAKKNYADYIDKNKENTIVPYPRDNVLNSYKAEGNFNVRPESSSDVALEKLSNRAKNSGIEISGSKNHFSNKRGRGTYTRTLSNTLEKPDITYTSNGNKYVIKKYNGITNGKENPFYDFVVEKDGKLYTKFVPDNMNYVNNQLKKPTQNMSLSGRVTGVEGTYPPPATDDSITQMFGGVNKKITVDDLGINDKLSNNQLRALNTAWKQGADSLKKGEAVGSLKHIDGMKKSINKMIEKSKVANPNGVGTVATSDTTELQELKGYLKDTMDKAGLSEISNQYARAKGLESAFNKGLKYSTNNPVPKFKTREEMNAFGQGIVSKISNGQETKNIAKSALDNTSAIKATSQNGKLSETLADLRKKEEEYGRISQLARKSEGKLGVADTQRGLERENFESPGSFFGNLVDIARNLTMKRKYERASQMLLGAKPIEKPLYDRLEQFVPSIASYLPQYSNKKGE